tara:strand:+ start:13045 stop:13920 length:876 start_codon:yes stop_codon:yes gene_type:complete
MSIIKIETMGYDGIFSHVMSGANVVVRDSITNEPETQQFFLEMGIWKFFKLFVWTTLPTYIIFLPIGIFIFLKNKQWKNIELILLGIISLIPAFYAASRGIDDTRYYFIFYPLFVIISLYFIQWITSRWKIKYFKLIIVAFVIVSSGIFLNFKDDSEYEYEIFHVVRENFAEIEGMNDIHPYSPYFRIMPLHLNNEFPTLRENIGQDIEILRVDDFESIEELFLSDEGKKITHLIVDDSTSRKEFLKEIFTNDEKYSFLEKIYDSSEEGLNHQVKIFKYHPQKFINLDEKR